MPTALYAASVIHAQLPFPPAEIDGVLAQLGPTDESLGGIALYDFFAVRDELRRRNGIKAVAADNEYDGYVLDDDDDEADFDDDE